MSSIVAEDKSLLQIEAEGEIVRQIEVGGNGECTSIDESVLNIWVFKKWGFMANTKKELAKAKNNDNLVIDYATTSD